MKTIEVMQQREATWKAANEKMKKKLLQSRAMFDTSVSQCKELSLEVEAAKTQLRQLKQVVEEEQKVQATSCDDLHKLVINQYKVFFDADQNKEVMHMAMDNCAGLIVKMQEPDKHNIEPLTAAYFDGVFKSHLRLLEKQIHSNWRLHKAYYEAQG